MNLVRILIIVQWILPWSSVTRGEDTDHSQVQSVDIVDDWHDPYLLAHEQQVNDFLGSAGLGILRVLPPSVPGIHGTLGVSNRFVNLPDGSDSLPIYHDLVGVAASPSPRVYCIQQAALQAKLKQGLSDGLKADSLTAAKASLHPFDGAEKRGAFSVDVRKLDGFEQAALAQLQSGHAYCSTSEGNLIRGMGAIRAQTSCLRCHDEAKEGDLLGAFTYSYAKEKHPAARPDINAFKNSHSEDISDKKHWERFRTKVGYATPPADQPYPADDYVWLVDHLWQDCGVIRDTLIQHIKMERENLERRHLANTTDQHLHGWPPTPTQKVIPHRTH